MVDNFEQIKSLLKFENKGDCYYVQLLRRQADDPKVNGVPDPKYHGNMHGRSIKDYLIKNVKHLESVKDEIIALCNMFNVRAYIRLNKRNYKKITAKLLKHIVEQIDSGETYTSPDRLVASACGMANCAGKNKTWVVDLDKEYLPYEKDIIEMICQCMPIPQEIQNIVPTKSGKHIICKPFNRYTFSHVPNKKEIEKAKEEGKEPKYGLWEMFCKSKGIELKCMDIHKDNPTILYVP